MYFFCYKYQYKYNLSVNVYNDKWSLNSDFHTLISLVEEDSVFTTTIIGMNEREIITEQGEVYACAKRPTLEQFPCKCVLSVENHVVMKIDPVDKPTH